MKLLLLITPLFFVLNISTAQVIEKDMRMSSGIQNALIVELNGANKKKAEKLWKNFGKEYGKVERDRKMDEYFIIGAIFPSIDTENPITLYTKFDEFDDMTKAYFWLKRDDVFLNSLDHEREINGADAFLTDYAIEVEKQVLKEVLDEEEDSLKGLQKDLSKLEKKNKSLHRDIEKAKDKIRKAEAEIEENEEEQEEVEDKIKEQKEAVEDASDLVNKVGKNRRG